MQRHALPVLILALAVAAPACASQTTITIPPPSPRPPPRLPLLPIRTKYGLSAPRASGWKHRPPGLFPTPPSWRLQPKKAAPDTAQGRRHARRSGWPTRRHGAGPAGPPRAPDRLLDRRGLLDLAAHELDGRPSARGPLRGRSQADPLRQRGADSRHGVLRRRRYRLGGDLASGRLRLGTERPAERQALVVDLFFENEKEAQQFAAHGPAFVVSELDQAAGLGRRADEPEGAARDTPRARCTSTSWPARRTGTIRACP